MMKSISQIFDLSGKVAVVTGGSKGIGKGIALRLAEAGASVVIVGRNMGDANRAVAEIKGIGGKSKATKADVSVAANSDKVIRFAMKEFGDLHILVNNAGIYADVSTLQMKEESWNKTLDTNLKSVMFFSKAAARAMIEEKHGGKIINITSISAFFPLGSVAHYDASKAGIVMLTKSMAVELAPYGILVNAIAPGAIATPGIDKLMSASKVAERMFKSHWKKIPVRHRGNPDDIGNAALFLASSASDYVVGHTLVVDGGSLLG
jgi:2-deoxy-D-gluconate 3-dehydrogenase